MQYENATMKIECSNKLNVQVYGWICGVEGRRVRPLDRGADHDVDDDAVEQHSGERPPRTSAERIPGGA